MRRQRLRVAAVGVRVGAGAKLGAHRVGRGLDRVEERGGVRSRVVGQHARQRGALVVQDLGELAQVRRVEAAAHRARERVGRRLQQLVEPRVVDLGEQDARRDVVEHAQPGSTGDSTGRSRSRLVANAWIVSIRARYRPRSAASRRSRSSASVVVVAGVLELLAHARGELRRRLLGERDDDELVDRRVAGAQHLDEPRDEHRRLARAGAGLDEQALVERRADALARRRRRASSVTRSASLRASTRAACGSAALRLRIASRRLSQTASKSHQRAVVVGRLGVEVAAAHPVVELGQDAVEVARGARRDARR